MQKKGVMYMHTVNKQMDNETEWFLAISILKVSPLRHSFTEVAVAFGKPLSNTCLGTRLQYTVVRQSFL